MNYDRGLIQPILTALTRHLMQSQIDAILAKGKSTLETVTNMRWWNDKLFSFRTTKPENHSFVAGQYARLGLPDEHGPIWRAYSMVSAPAEPELEFYGILVDGGLFTGKLRNLKPGDRILVEKLPFGFMTADRFNDGEDLWMLSTGTGIGPFISMLRDPLVWRRFRHLLLVHCVRHADEFAYRDELTRLSDLPHADKDGVATLQILRCVTRDIAGPDMLQGRITTLLENGALERAAGHVLNETGSRIMLCGNPDMIEDTRRLLHARGLRPDRRNAPGHFVTENYW